MNSEVSMNLVTPGTLVKVKVGCRVIEAVVLESLEHGWKVRSKASGKEFETTRIIEVVNTVEVPQAGTIEAAESELVEEVHTEESPTAEVETAAEPQVEETAAEPQVEETAAEPQVEETAAAPAKRHSLIDAAAEILKGSGEAMNTRDMVKAAIERGLWTPTNCKTPEQSLYGAIFREIKVTEQPRFRKSAKKGAFEYAL